MKSRISTVDQFKIVLEQYNEFLFIKHSLTCPISTSAFEEYEKFEEDHQSLPTFYLFVQDDRPLSNYIAETFSVKHESPQALLFRNGDVTWHASHWKITYSELTEQLT